MNNKLKQKLTTIAEDFPRRSLQEFRNEEPKPAPATITVSPLSGDPSRRHPKPAPVMAGDTANVRIEHYFPKGYDPDKEPWKSIREHYNAVIKAERENLRLRGERMQQLVSENVVLRAKIREGKE